MAGHMSHPSSIYRVEVNGTVICISATTWRVAASRALRMWRGRSANREIFVCMNILKLREGKVYVNSLEREN